MVDRYKSNTDIHNSNVREDLIQALDEKMIGFRDILWRSKSKRFRDKDAKTVKNVYNYHYGKGVRHTAMSA